MFIHYADGSFHQGALLSLRGSTMRVAIAGFDDVCEFVLRGGEWVSERLEIVSFSFPPALGWHEQLAQAV